MQNTCLSSSLALRYKRSLSCSVNDYSFCSNGRFCRHPFAFASPLLLQSPSLTCCVCCAHENSLTYKVPIAPRYLYGLRQSTLIQWAPCKNVILGGLDRVYSWSPSCDVDRRCYCEKVCDLEGKGVRRRRGVVGKKGYGCSVYEESSERCSLDGVNDEAEVMLSLLTEEVSEEFFDLRGTNERSSKKGIVEKKGDGGAVGASYRGKKKNVGSGILESSSKFEYESRIIESRMEDKRRKDEKRGEGRETLSRREGQRVIVWEEERQDSLRENQKARARKEERDGTSRKNRSVREEEREHTLRESRKASAREEERQNLLRREEHRERLRKDGSSCSSYYSLSSTGELESETEIQNKQEEFEELSRKYKRDCRRHGEITCDGEVEEGVERGEKYSDEQGLVLRKGNAAVGNEWNWRKKSEKKLTDISAEETSSQKELTHKQSKYSDVHDGAYGKFLYGKYDGQEEQTSAAIVNEESRRQDRQKGDEVVRQSETRMKYKESTELLESHGAKFSTSSSSQKQHSAIKGVSTKATSSVQEAREEHYGKADFISREEEYERKSHEIAQASNTQMFGTSKTSTSQVESATSRKDQEKASTTIRTSVYDAKEKHQRAGQFSRQDDLRKSSQQLIKDIDKESISTSQRESEHRIKKNGESSNLIHASYQESSEQNLWKNEDEAGRLGSRMQGEKKTDTLVVHYSGTGKTITDEGRGTKLEATLTPPSSQLVSRGASHADSSSGLAMEEVSHGYTLDSPSALQHETLGGIRRDETIGQPLGFTPQEDALRSADQLQKTSAYYVGEFVEKARHEISSSEIHKQKKTYETNMVRDHEQYEQKALTDYVSGDPQGKEHDSRLRHSSPGSGTKGPSDEMWHVTEPSNQEHSVAEVLEETSSAGNNVVKRPGRSLWNIIGDVVRLRWASRSTNHSATGKSGGRSSPNQSSNSEAWFSGRGPDENIDEGETSKKRSTSQESTYVDLQEEGRILSQSQGESSSSSSSKDQIKPAEGVPPSYAEVVAQGTASGSIFLPSGEGTLQEHTGGTLSSAVTEGSSIQTPALRMRRSPAVERVFETGVVDLSIPMPSVQLRRSPAVERVSEAGVVDASSGGKTVQTELPLPSVVSEVSQLDGKYEQLNQKKLQRTDQVMKDRFDEWEEAYRVEREQRKIDEMFMREALLEAKKAADSWEVPVGAVLVHEGKIIARGYNLVEELRDSTAHAEMICIREASNILRTWRLSETTLYVTLEPCPMCAGAILQARIDTVVWGAPNKLLGADGSWIRLFPSGEGSSLELSDKPPAPVHPFHPKIKIRRNVLELDCAQTMQQFFQLRRKKEKKQEPTTPPSCLPAASHPSKFLSKIHDAFHMMFCL